MILQGQGGTETQRRAARLAALGAPGVRRAEDRSRVDQRYRRSDRQIDTDLRWEVAHDPNLPDVRVDVQGAILSLSGSVPSRDAGTGPWRSPGRMARTAPGGPDPRFDQRMR